MLSLANIQTNFCFTCVKMFKRPVSPDAKASPVSKKPKTCNLKAYSVNFNAAWLVEFPWVKESSKSMHQAFCSSCNVDFSIAHSGKYDVIQTRKSCAFYWKLVFNF